MPKQNNRKHIVPPYSERSREPSANAAIRAVRKKRLATQAGNATGHGCPGCQSQNYGAKSITAVPSMIQPQSFLTVCHCLDCGKKWEEEFKPADIRTI